jgi:chitin disaccharide deacetylase
MNSMVDDSHGGDGRQLIVNADDFGYSPGVNAGVIRAHEQGIVTSASLMVLRPGAAEAAAYARRNRGFSLGIHLDLGEWIPREGHEGDWETVYEVVPLEDFDTVDAEVQRQLARFRELVGSDPTHVDSHQHVHTQVQPLVGVAFGRVARELSIPLRHRALDVSYCGDLYGQTTAGSPMAEAITVENLIEILRGLQPGVTELACHPGEGDDLGSLYREEREQEVRILCDPRVRETIERERIQLLSFAELRRP